MKDGVGVGGLQFKHQQAAAPTNSWISDISVQTSSNSSQCPSTRPSNDKLLPLKLQDFFKPDFYFACPRVGSKTPYRFLHRECRLPKHILLINAHTIPTNLISTLHILFNLIIPYTSYVYMLLITRSRYGNLAYIYFTKWYIRETCFAD